MDLWVGLIAGGLRGCYKKYPTRERVPSPQRTLERHGIVMLPPGKRFRYSNVGYRALDVAISTVSGKSYGEFLRDEVFLPLGMTRSALDHDPSWADEAAVRYDDSNRSIPST